MDIREKIILITGANSGIGLVTARQLAVRGAMVVMVCRDPVRGAVARDEIAKIATGPAPLLFIADLSSLAAIRRLAFELKKSLFQIDVLINNAGAIFAQREMTIDGIEKTFATNHLAPFLLTGLLLDLLRAAPSARILTVSSESHNNKLDFQNLQGERRYNFFDAYNRSKLGNILFTYELARRLEGTTITANCLSPGPTVTTFGDNMRGLPRLFPLLIKRIPFLFSSPETGALTSVYLASSQEIAGVSGKFFLRGRSIKTKSITYDEAVAAKLWTVSESLTGQREQPEISWLQKVLDPNII
jgi:NAD(P)-dependent dehydrogenase (short-subunit alcohol dehydrogenase family)